MAKPRPVIGVDIDLTIVDPVMGEQGWFEWLKRKYGIATAEVFNLGEDMLLGNLDYNLTQYFHITEGGDPFSYWKDETLYDNMTCYEDAKLVLQKLYEEYNFKIVFVSYTMQCGTHSLSKLNLLKREFPFISDEDFHFHQTKDKGLLSPCLDYMVDDRNVFLNQMVDTVKCFKYSTEYTQCCELQRDVDEVSNWSEILYYLEDE